MANEEKNQFTPYEKTHRLRHLLLVFTIVGNGQGKAIVDLNIEHEAAIAINTGGNGTAPSNIYSVFGVGELKKDVIISILRADRWPSYKQRLEERFAVSKLAKGLSFSIPLDAVAGISIYKMLTNTRLFEKPIKPGKEKKKEEAKEEKQ